MGLLRGYRDVRAQRQSRKRTANALRHAAFFKWRQKWGRRHYHNWSNRTKRLVGAVDLLRASQGNTSWVPADAIEAAKYYLEPAVAERRAVCSAHSWTSRSSMIAEPPTVRSPQ
jgi:hypothetical protein